jgi:hypothetical protein
LKNIIQIDIKILKASIDVQLSKKVEMIDIPNFMNEDVMTVDRDFLLIGLAGILNIEIDWDDIFQFNNSLFSYMFPITYIFSAIQKFSL